MLVRLIRRWEPLLLDACGEPPSDAAALTASYGDGISRNPLLMDGKKSTGFVAAERFLRLNGQVLRAADAACVLAMLAVAEGGISPEAFAAWVREYRVDQT